MRAWVIVVVLASAAAAAETPTVVSSGADGRDLAVTVYTVGRGVVRDARTVDLPAGVAALEYRGIAARVMPQTVAIDGDGVSVLEQNYEYDLLSPSTLMAKYLGREVTMIVEEPGPEPGEVVRRRVTGTLLSTEGGTIWRVGDDVVLNPSYSELRFPEVPGNLRERPTLVWLLDSREAGPRRVEATYLTEGLSWEADYVLTMPADDGGAELLGWFTVDNASGASFERARLQLVAGDVHLVATGKVRPMLQEVGRAAVASQVTRETLGEYHLYTVPRPTDLRDRQQKQISFLDAGGVRVVRRYRVDTPMGYFRSPMGEQEQPVRVDIEFANAHANGLGVPLPAGVVRLYRRDSSGMAQFVGEDRIGHTPEDETVTVTAGDAFDVVARRRQTDFRRFDSTVETGFEITLRNHKPVPVTVEVREAVGGDWEVLDSTRTWKKESASTILFTVDVPARGEAKVRYRVRIR